MNKVLITPRSVTKGGHPSLRILEAAGYLPVLSRPGKLPSEQELLELLPGCVGYIAGVEKISAKVLRSARGLKAISRNGSGTDAIDNEAAAECGIRILRTAGANARGVAELTMGCILALSRSLVIADRTIKNGDWKRFPGFELEGKTLGLIGCGRIGRIVTGFALAFGMKVIASDPARQWNDSPAGFSYAEFPDVLSCSDVLSLHCPPLPSGKPLFDSAILARVKRGCLIVNAARGELVDTDAMLQSLQAGCVAGLALDAYEQEPPVDRRLVEHPLVISTPHIGGFTAESIDRAMYSAVQGLVEVLGQR